MTDPLLLVIGAVLGLVLGLLGGGGGILAVPLLVAIGQPLQQASTMSLVVVATGAAAALVPHHRAGRVDWRVGLTFGALGSAGAIVGAVLSSRLAAPVLLGGFAALLVAGAIVMLNSGVRARAEHQRSVVGAGATPGSTTVSAGTPPVEDHVLADSPELTPRSFVRATGARASTTPITLRVVALATGVGLVTGLLGVGAGFVVVPALVAAMSLPVKRASATALVVIVINSLVALAVRHSALPDLGTTLAVALVTAVFGVLGAIASSRIAGWVLSTVFGALLALAAVYVLVHAATTG